MDEAEARLNDLAVDLLFLDIKMPGASGFDLLERLERVPLLVFTTAYDEFALRAFEVNACDYLLKPIRPDRLAGALDKMRALWTAGRAAAAAAPRLRLRSATDRVFLRDGDRCWIVSMGEIVYFEAEGNYARVYFGGNRPLIRTSLNALALRLDPALFFRASRRHLINLRFVEHIDRGRDEGFVVRLRGGHAVARLEAAVPRLAGGAGTLAGGAASAAPSASKPAGSTRLTGLRRVSSRDISSRTALDADELQPAAVRRKCIVTGSAHDGMVRWVAAIPTSMMPPGRRRGQRVRQHGRASRG